MNGLRLSFVFSSSFTHRVQSYEEYWNPPNKSLTILPFLILPSSVFQRSIGSGLGRSISERTLPFLVKGGASQLWEAPPWDIRDFFLVKNYLSNRTVNGIVTIVCFLLKMSLPVITTLPFTFLTGSSTAGVVGGVGFWKNSI